MPIYNAPIKLYKAGPNYHNTGSSHTRWDIPTTPDFKDANGDPVAPGPMSFLKIQYAFNLRMFTGFRTVWTRQSDGKLFEEGALTGGPTQEIWGNKPRTNKSPAQSGKKPARRGRGVDRSVLLSPNAPLIYLDRVSGFHEQTLIASLTFEWSNGDSWTKTFKQLRNDATEFFYEAPSGHAIMALWGSHINSALSTLGVYFGAIQKIGP